MLRASRAEGGALRTPNHRSPRGRAAGRGSLSCGISAMARTRGEALNEAAALSDDQKFATFLRLRAKALLDDDFYASDIAWIELENPKFDVIFAPYEVYLDDLLGVKTSYGAAVMIRNEDESRKPALFQKYVPEIEDSLPIAAEDRPSKAGHRSPMEVMDTPFRAGDLRHGYQAVADNLPNDPRIHQEKGSKKMFFKNFMDARVTYVVLPIAKRLLRADQAAQASGDGYLAFTMMHEISHELGPSYSHTANGRAQINEAIGPAYSALEESEADVVGMFGLDWLIEHGAMPKEKRTEYYASYVGGIFRTVRFGIAEAHGRGEMMEFNYLVEKGVIARDSALAAMLSIAATCPRRSLPWRTNCWRWKPPATGRAWKPGLGNMTVCRMIWQNLSPPQAIFLSM